MNKRKSKRISRLARISLFAAFICVTSLIQIPLGTVPVTMQLFGIYLALYTLGGVDGTASVMIYLALGALGLPVFSGYTGGVGRLFDATGGFILGFLILSLAYTLISLVIRSRRHASRFIATAVSLVLLYLSGALWYIGVYLDFSFSAAQVYLVGLIIPFLTDIVKIFLAEVIYGKIRKKV